MDRSPRLEEQRRDVEVITLGCRLNAYESEVMRNHAAAAGLDEVVVVNTCAVTAEAVRQSRQAIRRAHRRRPGARIVVTGCAAQIDPSSFASLDGVTQVIGNTEKLDAATFDPARLLAPDAPRVQVGDIMSVTETANHLVDGLDGRARAFVQVQTGCDHRCTFCIIPYGRGNSRSAPAGEIVDQVRRLAARHHEVVLTGVDLTSWGGDLPNQPKLGNLVARILKLVPDLAQLRLSSIDAIEMDEQLFETVTGDARVAPHLHLSLQAGDDLILKRMKRRHSRKEAIELCTRLRAHRPEIALGADFIVGFPTETEEMFQMTLDLVDACGIDYLHVFPYSAREGTPAARMPAVGAADIKDRARRLREKGAERLASRLDRHVGLRASALVEAGGRARLPDFAPVRIDGPSPPPGGPAMFDLVGRTGDELIGRAS
ncbi:tRNA (N(6)-L-threonylcarbamoyladenosine(37)-C(2))-methylthiotransferase MtaB [bacterium]|nr:tRNA (N(6)-L-threonylcarbamoyladenosine(37)-C(2))-methylthiotransferase MtaB [bacterium]